MPSVWIIRALLLGWLSAWSDGARAEDLAPEALKIVLVAKKSRKVPKDGDDGGPTALVYQKSWKKACDQLGAALLAGKGPWGFGAFSEASCYRGRKRIGGSEESARWVLNVVDGKAGVTFALTYNRKNHDAVAVAELKLPPSAHFFEFFEDDEFTDVTAFSLLEQMPMALHVGSPMKGRHWRAGLTKGFKFPVPEPPEELLLYRLAWSSEAERWRSQVIGTAKRGDVTGPRRKKTEKATILVGGEVAYVLDENLAVEIKDGDVWAQDARGPGARTEELAKVGKDADILLETEAANGSLLDYLRGTSGTLLSNLLRTAASGYVGLRYGLEVLPGNELLKKTHIFSLLVEIRGGPAKGLRYYYDKLPATTTTLTGENGAKATAEISWSRHVLGYSFDFNPGVLLDRITIDPKLGMWRFEARLPVPNEADPATPRTESIKLGKTFSLDLEVGGELLSDWYTLRGWYAIDGGFSLLKQGGSVSSNRFGADAYFTAGPTFPILGIPFKTALLAFYVYEAVNVSTGKNDNLQPGQVAISSVPYSAGYAGGGILITW